MAINLLPPSPLGSPPGSGFWNDWYEKLRVLVNTIASGFSWSLITGTPTTFVGYGIATNSANLASVLSDETGTGLVVFNNTPTLVTPVLGIATGTSLALAGGIALVTTNQTGTGNLVLANTPTLITPVLGVATGTSVVLTGGITTGNATLHTTTTALTNGAAAATGTLTNAPTAGNPTKWAPVNDNGTIRYIPMW